MEAICLSELKSIIKQKDGVCVSIFMPTQSSSGADPQNIIRFKNLIHKAEEQLVLKGLRTSEARTLLQKAESLITNKPFWNQRSKGLAFYLNANGYFYYRVPIFFQEFVSISTRFYIKPLISLLGQCGTFYVLVLSQNENRLLQCTATDSIRINLENIPKSLAESMGKEVPDSRVQYRSSASKTVAGESTQVSGSGSLSDINKKYILKYFEEIGKGINQVLREGNIPLILAGADFLHPLYRQGNKYADLLNEGITGNSDDVSDDALREQGWNIVKPYFDKSRSAAISEFVKTSGLGRTASGELEVLPAACNGRVRFLFVREDAQQWGRFDAASNSVSLLKADEKDSEELIDLAIYNTLKNDGTVYELKTGEMPGNMLVSAVLRY
jgi:hypothetical protein